MPSLETSFSDQNQPPSPPVKATRVRPIGYRRMAELLAGLLDDGQLNRLTELMDGDASNSLLDELNRLNRRRNPQTYASAGRVGRAKLPVGDRSTTRRQSRRR